MRWLALLTVCVVSIGCGSGQQSALTPQAEITRTISTRVLPRDIEHATSLDVDRFGNIFVLSADQLIKLDSMGDSVRAVSGKGREHYQFDDAVDLDTHIPNTVLVADRLNHRIEIYSRDLVYLSTIYTRDNTDPLRRFGYPRAVAGDKAGNIFVLDGESQRVLKFHSDRTFERTFGGYGESSRAEAMLSEPVAISTDDEDRVSVLDRAGRSIVLFDNFGTPIARRDLDVVCSRLAAIHDTLFALSSHLRGGDMLLMFALPLLTPLGLCSSGVTARLTAMRPELTVSDAAGIRDIATRPAGTFWISGRQIARLSFHPQNPELSKQP